MELKACSVASGAREANGGSAEVANAEMGGTAGVKDAKVIVRIVALLRKGVDGATLKGKASDADVDSGGLGVADAVKG